MDLLHPKHWRPTRGYSSGVAASGRQIFVAGQIGWDAGQEFVSDDFVAQAEQALYVWYQKMAEPILPKDGEDAHEADYMTACWKWKHRDATGAASLEQLAKDANLRLPFLQNWWAMLTNPEPKSRYLDVTRVAWNELPPPDAARVGAVVAPFRAGAVRPTGGTAYCKSMVGVVKSKAYKVAVPTSAVASDR